MMTDINGRSVEDVLSNYDLRSNQKGFKPYYIVKIASHVKFSHTEDDALAGRELLEENLRAAKAAGSCALMSVIYFKRLDKNGEPTGTGESFNVSLNEAGSYPAIQSGNGYVPVYVNEIKSSLDSINGRLAALEEDDEDEEDQEDEGFLSGITKDPEMKNALMRMLFQQMGFINAKQGYQGGPAQPINGVEMNESDKIRQALKIMAKHTSTLGDDLMKLATIAETDPNQFNFLLSMLRKG